MTQPSFSYSMDGERYKGRFPSRDLALAQGVFEAKETSLPGAKVVIHTGQLQPVPEVLHPYAARIGEKALDIAEQCLEDEISSDGPVIELTDEKTLELGRLIVAWLSQNASFSTCGVVAVEQHSQITGS